jgi:hypothetical protein
MEESVRELPTQAAAIELVINRKLPVYWYGFSSTSLRASMILRYCCSI